MVRSLTEFSICMLEWPGSMGIDLREQINGRRRGMDHGFGILVSWGRERLQYCTSVTRETGSGTDYCSAIRAAGMIGGNCAKCQWFHFSGRNYSALVLG